MSYIKEHKKSVIFGVVCVLLLAAGLKGCLSEERPTYMTMSAFKGDIVKKVYATGTVAGQTQVDVGAQVSGQILKLYVKTGQDVKAGDLLCEIDPKIQETALQTAQASVDSIDNQITAKKAELKKLSLEYQRQKNLRKLDATSKQDAEFAEAEYDIAKASLADLNTQRKKAQLSVDDAQTKLSYTQIRAPIDGTVYATVVSEGQTVNANQTTPTIMRLATMDKMKVLTEISEADVVNVEPGMECTFTILGKPFRIFRGVLQSIDPAPSDYQSSNNTTSSSSASSTQAIYYNSEISVDNEDRTLRIDMTADVVINIDERHDISFMRYDFIKKRIPTIKTDYKNYYNKVYEYTEDVNVKDEIYLEQVFEKFNLDRPDDFKGHSLSVSDIVKLNDKLYICDSFGFALIE